MMNSPPEPHPWRVGPMDEAAATAIAGWRYPPPYGVYNPTPDIVPYLVDLANDYVAVRTPAGTLVGFFCFGAEAQVSGGQRAELYGGPGMVDIGLGMDPALTGRGGGLAFVEAGLAFARQRDAPAGFRLTVATFNVRAMRVYRRAGFAAGPIFSSPTADGQAEFMIMTRPAWLPGAP